MRSSNLQFADRPDPAAVVAGSLRAALPTDVLPSDAYATKAAMVVVQLGVDATRGLSASARERLRCDGPKELLLAVCSCTIVPLFAGIYGKGAGIGAREELNALSRAHGAWPAGVPTFHAAGQLIVGFESPETTGREVLRLIDAGTAAQRQTVDRAHFGTLSAQRLGLPLFTRALRKGKLGERAGRGLKLVSGVVMLALGALLVFKPEWLV